MVKKDPMLGYECCIEFLKLFPGNSSKLPSIGELCAFEAANSENVDSFQLVRGHDLCEVMSILIKQNTYCKAGNINGNKIATFLRLSFGREEFRKTKLYSDLQLWFSEHNYKDMFVC